MKRRFSIPFGTLLGAKLTIHPLLPLMLLLAWRFDALPYYLMLFALVFGHELCHSIAARALGVQVLEIELAPFGGVARVSVELEARPAREIAIALAGPAFNLLLVLFASLLDRYYPLPPQWLASFIGANLLIGGFNLLPALPLDGGRVLRAALTGPLGLQNATNAAAAIGLLAGAALLAFGLYNALSGTVNLTYFITGFLLLAMAYREGRGAQTLVLRDLTARSRSLKKGGALSVRTLALPRDATVKAAVRQFRPNSYHRVVLLDDDLRERGELSERGIVRALMEGRSQWALKDIT